MSKKKTMEELSYGYKTPADILAKLERVGARLSPPPAHEDDKFDFIVTASVLPDWIKKYYEDAGVKEHFGYMGKKEDRWRLPDSVESWMIDLSCFRNKHYQLRKEISDALAICTLTSNASKHYEWKLNDGIESMGPKPKINNWAEYFRAKTGPDFFIVYKGANYGLIQVRDIVIQFYRGLIPYLDRLKEESESC